MIDVIIAVDDIEEWHNENIKINKNVHFFCYHLALQWIMLPIWCSSYKVYEPELLPYSFSTIYQIR